MQFKSSICVGQDVGVDQEGSESLKTLSRRKISTVCRPGS